MGRPSDARERLVDSGSELMHERGYTAVGVKEICSAAGVKKGSFYHFFPSKVELALAVIDRLSSSGRAALVELAEGAEPPLDRLAAYLDGLCQGQVALRESCGKVLGCPIGNLGLEMSTQEPRLRERLHREFDRTVEGLESVLREAVERGGLSLRVTKQAARSVLALIEGTVMLAKMKDDPAVLAGLRRDVLALIGADASVVN